MNANHESPPLPPLPPPLPPPRCGTAEKKPSLLISIRAFKFIILSAIILATLADWLFYLQPRGWTLGAFGLLLTIAILIRGGLRSFGSASAIITLALLALYLNFVEAPNRLSLLLSLLGIISLALTINEGWSSNLALWGRRWLYYVAAGWCFAPAGLIEIANMRRSAQPKRNPRSWLQNWLLALLFGLLFVWIFSLANPIIALWTHSFRIWLTDCLHNLPSPLRIFCWLLVVLQVSALLGHQDDFIAIEPLAKQQKEADDEALAPLASHQGARQGVAAESDWLSSLLAPAAVLRALALFNLLFAAQTILDIRYLWGGATLPATLTYAQYAHRGAYPLIATTLLAGLFVLVTFRSYAPARHLKWSRRLVYLWLLQNLFLMVSAAWRLWLYVDIYSLTRLRVATAIWILLIACGVLWIMLRLALQKSNLWLIRNNFLTALATLFICAFINFDAHIASFNVNHCEELRGKGFPSLDIAYLQSLGSDTLPALIQLHISLADHPRQRQACEAAISELGYSLRSEMRNWRGWSWRRARTMRSLEAWEQAQ